MLSRKSNGPSPLSFGRRKHTWLTYTGLLPQLVTVTSPQSSELVPDGDWATSRMFHCSDTFTRGLSRK
jgi:hypothetical protein